MTVYAVLYKNGSVESLWHTRALASARADYIGLKTIREYPVLSAELSVTARPLEAVE